MRQRTTEAERETTAKDEIPATKNKTRSTLNMMFSDECSQSLGNHSSTNTYAPELWSETAVTLVSPWTSCLTENVRAACAPTKHISFFEFF